MLALRALFGLSAGLLQIFQFDLWDWYLFHSDSVLMKNLNPHWRMQLENYTLAEAEILNQMLTPNIDK
jgi:hypothetical protein